MLGTVEYRQKSRIQKPSYCILLTTLCFILLQLFLGGGIYADQSIPAATLPALPQTALPQPELPQPSPPVEKAYDFNNTKNLPLVPAGSLEKLTLAEIKSYFPDGIQILSASLSMTLKKKLTTLEKQGYEVLYLRQSNRELQLLTGDVISHYEKKEFDRFLSSAYQMIPEAHDQNASVTNCPVFLKKIFIPYILRENKYTRMEALKDLSKYSPVVYEHFLYNHPFWNDLGFASMNEAPESLKSWLSDAAVYSHDINQKILKTCGVYFIDKRLFYISEIIALDYLSSSVNRTYYNQHNHQRGNDSQLVTHVNSSVS